MTEVKTRAVLQGGWLAVDCILIFISVMAFVTYDRCMSSSGIGYLELKQNTVEQLLDCGGRSVCRCC